VREAQTEVQERCLAGEAWWVEGLLVMVVRAKKRGDGFGD
jgi:hypothetical protein